MKRGQKNRDRNGNLGTDGTSPAAKAGHYSDFNDMAEAIS